MCFYEEFRFKILSKTIRRDLTWDWGVEELILGAGDDLVEDFCNDVGLLILSTLNFELSLPNFSSQSTQLLHLLFWKHSCPVEICRHGVVKGEGHMRSLLHECKIDFFIASLLILSVWIKHSVAFLVELGIDYYLILGFQFSIKELWL